MRHIISALLACISTTWAIAQEAKPIELAPNAPDRHIVVRGDTLWGISSKFLKDPYRWPEVWRMNPEEIRNPHRIYPGQVVILDRTGANPRLKIGKLIKSESKLEPKIYETAQAEAIPAIPQQAIEPFLSQPLVIEEGALEKTPRIVATQEGRVYVGTGGQIFVSGITAPAAKYWQVYRPGKPLKNPDDGSVMGHEAVFLGDAHLVSLGENGEAATMVIAKSKLEIGRGDSVMPAAQPEVLNYLPHPPLIPIKARVASIYGGVGEAGQFAIVAINRGKLDELEVGHVLALYRTGETVTNKFDLEAKPQTAKLPDEKYGLLFVFRVFDKVSYALVMETSRPVLVGDTLKTPE